MKKTLMALTCIMMLSGCASRFTEPTLQQDLVVNAKESKDVTATSQSSYRFSPAMQLTFLAVNEEYDWHNNIDKIELSEFEESAGILERNWFSLLGTASLIALNANPMDTLAFGLSSAKPKKMSPWYGENILFTIKPINSVDDLYSEITDIRNKDLNAIRNMFKAANVPFVENEMSKGKPSFLDGGSYIYNIPEVMFVRTDSKPCLEYSQSPEFLNNHEPKDQLLHCVIKVNTVQNSQLLNGELVVEKFENTEKHYSIKKADHYLVTKVGIPTGMPISKLKNETLSDSYLYTAPLGWSGISSMYADNVELRNTLIINGDISVYPHVMNLESNQDFLFLDEIWVNKRKNNS
ncbi:hypothetical protein [Aliivibrio fischeri]|uniref:hypothetical protein n=1 Tax=Aliivibrio fischeri TaxID=668 RepID=UPI0012D8D069|nr:hypothetical protein [Aliivibrio fischeri]MUJ20334.1 hypothetical protein [Aliivibrio fischeri]